MEHNILKKIWHDPVISKIIGGLLTTAILSVLGLITKFIGELLNNGAIINVIGAITNFIYINIKNIIIILLILIVVILFYNYLKIKYPRKIDESPETKKENAEDTVQDSLKWMINILEKDPGKYVFLLWFPINGLTAVQLLNMTPIERVNIRNSKTYKTLEEKNILKSGLYYKLEINNIAYEYLDNYCKQRLANANDEDIKGTVKILKKMPFEEIMKICVLLTDYDI